MSVLPDELWRRIFEIGIETQTLDFKNLCCLSITCRRLRRLTADDSLWSILLLSDFKSTNNNQTDKTSSGANNHLSSSTAAGKLKSIYKIRYEKDREQKRLAHRRLVLRIESEIAEHRRKIRELEIQSREEKEKLNAALVELMNLRRVRQASAASNVWQPEIVRSRQKQMVEQCTVRVEYRINALEMEINLCKQQIAGFDTAIRVEKRRLDVAEEQLASVSYHPLQDTSSSSFRPIKCRTRSKKAKYTSSVKCDTDVRTIRQSDCGCF